MTAQQFNDKYKDFIEPGFGGLQFDDPQVTTFLDRVFADFTKIPGFQFAQIKLKFGMARFYSTLSATTGLMVETMINKLLTIPT